MPWFRVDDGFHSHPKALATSLAARGLWVTAGSWSSDNLTDGVVPDHVLASLGGTPELAAELVAAGLWRRRRQSYVFHEFLSRNPSKEAVENERKQAAERQRRRREAMKSRRDNGVTHGVSPPAPSRTHPGFKTVDVINQPNGSSGYDRDLIDSIIAEVRTVTGRSISDEWAGRVAAELLKGRAPASPAAYVRQAIRNEPNPRVRFLPLY